MQVDGRDPTRFGFHGYVDQTTLHPIGLTALILAIVWLLSSSRKTFVWPVVFLLCIVPPAQRIVIGGIDFNFLRIIVLVGLLHALVMGWARGMRGSWADKAMVFVAAMPAMFSMLRGQSNLVIMYTGQGGDLFACYLLARIAIRDCDDLRRLARALAVMAIVAGFLFAIEFTTMRNMFSVFGGVEEFTRMRQGKLRCQGPFPHPIIAGVWWASALPIVGSLWWSRRKHALDGVLAVCGAIGASIAIYTSNSSTPMGIFFAMIIMALAYPMRRHFGKLAMLVVVMVVFVHFASSKGIHHVVFTRANLASGSTGWHRFRLYDAAFDRVGEWGMIGSNSTYHWGWGLDDVTSLYVQSAIGGGLVLVVLIIALMAWGVRVSWKAVLRFDRDPMNKAPIYAIGMAILGLAAGGLGVSFFGQGKFLWPFLMGVIPSLAILNPIARARVNPRRAQPGRVPRRRVDGGSSGDEGELGLGVAR